jgi:hypothetical protein
MTMKSTDRRVQFDVLPARLADFDRLMTLCDLKTRKDLFDNAITLLEWAVNEVVLNGRKVASYDSGADDVQIVRLPVLENAARKAVRPVELVRTDGTATEVEDSYARTHHLAVVESD